MASFHYYKLENHSKGYHSLVAMGSKVVYIVDTPALYRLLDLNEEGFPLSLAS